jgi:flagellar biogenesis protein FliO
MAWMLAALAWPLGACAAPLSDPHPATASAPASSASTSSAGSPVPYMADGDSVSPLTARVLGALLVCALVGAVLIQLMRGGQGRLFGLTGAAPRRLQVLEAQSLGGKARLLVVRYEQSQLLLAQSEHGITLLQHKPDAAEAQR